MFVYIKECNLPFYNGTIGDISITSYHMDTHVVHTIDNISVYAEADDCIPVSAEEYFAQWPRRRIYVEFEKHFGYIIPNRKPMFRVEIQTPKGLMTVVSDLQIIKEITEEEWKVRTISHSLES